MLFRFFRDIYAVSLFLPVAVIMRDAQFEPFGEPVAHRAWDAPAPAGQADPGRLLRRSGIGVFWALVAGVVAARAVYFDPDLLGKLGDVAAFSKRLCAVFV